LDRCELVVVSDRAVFQEIPWELMLDPDTGVFMALAVKGFYRTRSKPSVPVQFEPPPSERLNVLLVIARPYGERDVGLRTIAGPLLNALGKLGSRVNVEVLRPHTFDAMARRLNERKGFYHIVHFDGHGASPLRGCLACFSVRVGRASSSSRMTEVGTVR
jgi:hypothetical protein